MTSRIPVCHADELPEGNRTVVSIKGVSVGVFNVDGDYYAMNNRCVHQGGPVCEGMVHQNLVGEYHGPGERVEEKLTDQMVISCPWHGWEYDLETGEHLGDPDIRQPVYDVVVDDDELYIEV